jgi:hypothetical protein
MQSEAPGLGAGVGLPGVSCNLRSILCVLQSLPASSESLKEIKFHHSSNMHIRNIFLATAASSLTEATPFGFENAQPLPDPVQDLFPRQTSNSSGLLADLINIGNQIGLGGCVPQFLPLVTILPPLPKGLIGQDIVTQAVSQTTLRLDEVCQFSITGTVGTIYSSWVPTGASFFDAFSSDIASVVSRCPKASEFSSTIVAYTKCPVWSGKLISVTSTHQLDASTTRPVSGGAGGAATTPAGTTRGPPTPAAGAQSTSAQADAPRHTGAVLAGAALAGVLAAVAAL